MDQEIRIRAAALWREAYQHQLHAFALARDDRQEAAAKEMGAAIELYSQSIDTCPTAEAFTFRGWAYHCFGKVDEAIEECKRAIEVDPDFGNPYNDIGAYLLGKDRPDEAIEWLEKAKLAPRYEPRHFPYINLSKIYRGKGMIARAIQELEEGLRLAADDDAATQIGADLRQLRGMLN